MDVPVHFCGERERERIVNIHKHLLVFIRHCQENALLDPCINI